MCGLHEKEREPSAQEQAKEGDSCNRAEPTTAVDQATENKDRQHRALRTQSATHQSPLPSSPPPPPPSLPSPPDIRDTACRTTTAIDDMGLMTDAHARRARCRARILSANMPSKKGMIHSPESL